jgi:hypothetical protein
MKLTVSGIIFWVAAWGFVTTLIVYCYARVLRRPKRTDRDEFTTL